MTDDVPTGSRTLLHNFNTICRNGNSMEAPKKYINSAGVANIPIIFPKTAFAKDAATLPFAAPVNKTHIFTVVGKHVRIRIPSNKAFGNKLGKNFLIAVVNGTPTRNGQARNDPAWIIKFNLMFAMALFNSDNSSDNPDKRKMHVTPNFPIKSSGFIIPPFTPS